MSRLEVESEMLFPDCKNKECLRMLLLRAIELCGGNATPSLRGVRRFDAERRGNLLRERRIVSANCQKSLT